MSTKIGMRSYLHSLTRYYPNQEPTHEQEQWNREVLFGTAGPSICDTLIPSVADCLTGLVNASPSTPFSPAAQAMIKRQRRFSQYSSLRSFPQDKKPWRPMKTVGIYPVPFWPFFYIMTKLWFCSRFYRIMKISQIQLILMSFFIIL
jgi:hypothetical protein